MNVSVIHEDKDILVINKPSGMVVHPFDFSTEETLIDFLQQINSEMFSIENTTTLQDGRVIHLGGIVHKLDRDTSGVMVVAKNNKIFNELREQFKEHTTRKKYVALVEGVIQKDSFTIDAPLGRNKKEYKQSVNPSNPRGELRNAITQVKVISRNKTNTLVELSPITGRTHQLRAHMAFIGHPIVGDSAYGSTVENLRIMLHAQTLTLMIDGKEVTFTAPVPVEFSIN